MSQVFVNTFGITPPRTIVPIIPRNQQAVDQVLVAWDNDNHSST